MRQNIASRVPGSSPNYQLEIDEFKKYTSSEAYWNDFINKSLYLESVHLYALADIYEANIHVINYDLKKGWDRAYVIEHDIPANMLFMIHYGEHFEGLTLLPSCNEKLIPKNFKPLKQGGF